MHAQNTSHRPASDRATAHRHDQRCAPAPHAQNPKHKSSRLSGWELRARLASLARSLEPPSPFFWALHQDCPDRGSNTAPLASQSDYLTHYTTKIARDVTESTKLTQIPCCTKACAREPCYISWYTYIQNTNTTTQVDETEMEDSQRLAAQVALRERVEGEAPPH